MGWSPVLVSVVKVLTEPQHIHHDQDGTPVWTKPAIDGPGVWVTCVKGKEKQTVGELYDLFESVRRSIYPLAEKEKSSVNARRTPIQLAEEIWPNESDDSVKDKDGISQAAQEGEAVRTELDLEAQVAREIAGMKRPRKEGRLGERDGRIPSLRSAILHHPFLLSSVPANCRTDTPCGTSQSSPVAQSTS